jgi:hypothetical protein
MGMPCHRRVDTRSFALLVCGAVGVAALASSGCAGAAQSAMTEPGDGGGGAVDTSGPLSPEVPGAEDWGGVGDAGQRPGAADCSGALTFGDPDVEKVVRELVGVSTRPLQAMDVRP